MVFKSPSFLKNYIFRDISGLCIRKTTAIEYQDVMWPEYKLEYYNSLPDCSLSGFRNRNIFIFCRSNPCFAGAPIIRPDEFLRQIQWLNCLLNSIVSILITFPDFSRMNRFLCFLKQFWSIKRIIRICKNPVFLAFLCH